MKVKIMKQRMQWLANLIVTGLLFAAVENGRAQLKEPNVYLPTMDTNGPLPGLAHVFDDLTVNGEPLKVNTVGDLQEALQLLQSDPPVPLATVPKADFGGDSGIGFWSLQNPEWPPLPGNTIGTEVWPVGNGRFVLADSQYSYRPVAKVKAKVSAMTADAPPDPGSSGTGDTNTYELTSFSSAMVYSTNDLWLAIVGQNNSVSSLVIHTPWNVTGSNFMFDVFATTNLLPNVPGLNGTNWMFVTRGLPGQTNLFVSPMPNAPVCFFRLGTLQDSDNDGLTDAFEKLVSHTDPNVWDSNGNGIGDGDEMSPYGVPWRLVASRSSSVVVFANNPTATQSGSCGQATVYLPTPAPAGGTTVQYFRSGTAVLGSDYSISSANQLFIPAGQLSGTISICALGANSWSALNLYTDITLTNAGSYLVDGTPARVNIVQTGSPGVRVFALPPWSYRPSTTYGTNQVGFYFIRDGSSTNLLTFNVSIAGSTAASNTEYVAFSKTITFPANVRTNWLPVTLIANGTNPTNTTLIVTITNAPGYQIDSANGSATLTIAATAAPVLPTVTITNSIPIASTTTAGQFTITRTPAGTNSLRVYFNTWSSIENVTGRSGTTDTTTYNVLPDYVDIPPNITSTNVAVAVNNAPSAPVLIVATLSAGDYSIGSNNTATVTLDPSGSTTVSVAPTRAGLHNGFSGVIQDAELTFTRSGSVANPLSLAWFNVSSAGLLGLVAQSGQMANFSMPTNSTSRGAIVWPAGVNVIKTNLSITYGWNDSGRLRDDDSTVYLSVSFSNAYYQGTVPVTFLPAWEQVSLGATTAIVTNGTTHGSALTVSRIYNRVGTGPQHAVQVIVSTSGSAVAGTDFTMNTTVNIDSNVFTVNIPVTALNATNQGWRTLVAKINPAANGQVIPRFNLDTGLVRIANPNNLIDDTDIDGDGIPDGFEIANSAYGLDPLTPNNPNSDVDRDGIGLMDELSLNLNPNLSDSPPKYPSIEDSDYVNLTLRVGAVGKMLPSGQSCAQCHAVTVRVGSELPKSTGKTDWTHNPRLTDYLIHLPRGTNYPVQITASPITSLLTSNQAAATSSPHYTAAYVAQFMSSLGGIYPFIIDTNNLLGTNLSMVKEILPKRATLYIPDLTIATDNDRDGGIDFKSRADRTSATNPFVFWINNDVDAGLGNAASDLTPTNNPPDSANTTIDSERDLEDFARLQFKIDNLPSRFLTNGNYQIKLYLTNLVGTPSLRLFPAVESNGGIGYLTNDVIANSQMAATALGVVSNGAPLTMVSSFWPPAGTNSFFSPMIFEGISTGSCVLTFGFSSNNAPPVAVSRPFYLTLKKATDLYEHWTTGDDTITEWNQIADSPSPLRTPDSPVFPPLKSGDDLDTIVFVHGWRMQPWERRAFASTAYKRLYWQHYKGRLEFFSWPTDWEDLDNLAWYNPATWGNAAWAVWDKENFDRSEQRAWNSAHALQYLLGGLDKLNVGHIRLMAHSMGNIVAAETLRLATDLGQKNLIHTYVAMEGATPSHCYDSNAPVRPLNSILGLNNDSGTFELYRYYWKPNTLPPSNDYNSKPYLFDVNAAKNMVNYFNSSDAALSVWQYDQDMRPDLGWHYYAPNSDPNIVPGFFKSFTKLDPNYSTMRYEIFSRAVEARCFAIGAQTNVGGPFQYNQLDLYTQFGFTSAKEDHSAAFNSTIQNRFQFWKKLVSDFNF